MGIGFSLLTHLGMGARCILAWAFILCHGLMVSLTAVAVLFALAVS
ncbi:MAG: hypothetical protein HQM01_11390 [Magnetococcales bacterium]|nr:hypothetical protein [Magnetococcales bacterium]